MSRTSDERGQLGDQADPPAAEIETPPYHKEDERRPGRLAVLRETVVLVALAVLLAAVFKTFLVAAFYIPSGSMESTLNISDRVLVEKVSYRFGDVQRGDVVVFVHDEPGFEPPRPSNPVAGFFSSLGAQPERPTETNRAIPREIAARDMGASFLEGRPTSRRLASSASPLRRNAAPG